VAGEVTVRWAARVEVRMIEVPDPHAPASKPIVTTDTNQAR
jgi:hypothetical protein